MDYKYIEQLLENYWNCETSTEEEQILRSFFSQKDVPVHLLKYKELFAYEQASSKEELGEDFDSRVLDIIEKPAVKAKVVTFRERIAPNHTYHWFGYRICTQRQSRQCRQAEPELQGLRGDS